jgi:hypothetical protein
MNIAVRMLIAASAMLLFLGLRTLSLFRLDHALLSRLAGGSHAAPLAALVPISRD